MAKRRLLFETSTKKYYEGPEPNSLIQNFREGDDGVGVLNHRLSEYFMQGLGHIGVPTHFLRRLNMHESLIHHLEMLPIEILVRNRADEQFSEQMGVDLGVVLPRPIVEFYYKNENGARPPVSEEHIIAFGWAGESEMDDLIALCLRVNDFLAGVYWAIGYLLVDFRLEIGRQTFDDFPPILMLADEIGPAMTQLWDLQTTDENKIVRPSVRDVAERLGVVQNVMKQSIGE